MPDVAGDHGPLLDDYLLALTGVPRPRVCFIGTASGDAASYVEKFHLAFRGRADTAVLALFNSEPEAAIPLDQLDQVLEQDVVYVGGGLRRTCSRCGGCTVSTPCLRRRPRRERCWLASLRG